MLQVVVIFKVDVHAQSKIEHGSVGILSYSAWVPYIIIKNIGHNSYEVQNCLKDTAAIQKYKALNLYLLSSFIFPSAPLDTIGQWYIHY